MKPARPAPVKLYDEPWKRCGKAVCLSPKEAQRSLENKVEVGRFIRGQNDLLDFYEDSEDIRKP